MLHCVSFLFLVQLGTLSVTAHALTFFAVATFISVERTFILQLVHFVSVEVGLVGFVSTHQGLLEADALGKVEFGSD